MGLALVWLIAASAWLAAEPTLLGLSHPHPHVIAHTHAWVLGFAVTVACGAMYQLAPVSLGTMLWSERLGWWHFGLHALGVPLMVYSFRRWDLVLLGHAGFAVAVGVLFFSVNIWQTVRRAGKRGVVAWSLALSAAWLLLTVLAGLLLAANRFWQFLPLDPLALLRAHAHLGLVGFFVTLLQGVSFQLVPMFTLGEVRSWRLPTAALALAQAGLIALVPALAWHFNWAAFGGAIAIAAGMACSTASLARVLATRRKRTLEPGLRAFLTGGAGLLVAAVAGLVLLAPGTPWGSAAGGFNAMVYGILGLVGGLLPCIAGLLCKIVPFLTWMRAYGPRVGRGATLPASALSHPALERWGLALQFLAVAPLVAGAWMLSEPWLRAGAWLFAGGGALFVANMVIVLRHLRTAANSTAAITQPGGSR